jgi:hypothetical protein
MDSKPTHEQAQLQLELYDLRREARIRQGREWYFRNYFPETFEDSMRIAGPGAENGPLVMMVFGYWEQACGLLNYGLLHEDLFFETSGELFGVWERVRPIIQQAREKFANPQFLANLEQADKRFEACSERRAPAHIAVMRQLMKQIQTQTLAAAKA